MEENIIIGADDKNPPKKRSAQEIALESFKNIDKLPDDYTPGVATNLDLEKTSNNLGIANRPGLGLNYITEKNNQAEAQKAYNVAAKQADEQGFFGEMVGSLTQATVGQILGGAIEGVGYLVDPNQLREMEEGSQSLGKMISDAGKALREGVEEFAPIHVNPETEGSFKPWKSEWWFSGIPSVASFASILLPVAGEAKLLGLAGEGLSTLNKLGKAGTIGKETSFLGKVLDKTADILKQAPTSVINRTVVSTHIEAMMEASQTFEEELRKLTDSGMDESEARKLAGESASFVYKANYANLATEFLQQKFLLRGPQLAKQVDGAIMAKAAGLNANVGRFSAAKDLFKVGASEAFEEAYQFGIQEEGKYLADVKAGLVEEKDFTERLKEYSTNAELWNSAFFGALGGTAMQAIGPKMNETIQKNILKNTSESWLTEKQQRINDLNSQKERIMQSVTAYSKAVKTGNEDAINAAKSKMSFDLGVSAAKNGNLQFMIERFNNLKNLTPEEKQQLEIEEDTPLMVDDIKKDINKAAELWKDNTIRYGEEFAESISYREFHIDKLNSQLPDVKQRYDNLIMKLPRYNEITVGGKHTIENKIAVEGLDRSIQSLQWRVDNQEMPASEKVKLQEVIKTKSEDLKQAQINLKTQLSVNKDTFNDADNLILKTLDGKQGEDLAKIKSLNNLYNYQVESYTDELNYLTSKEGQKIEKEKSIAATEAFLKSKKDAGLQHDIDEQELQEAVGETTSAIDEQTLDEAIQSGKYSENDLSPELKQRLKDYREGKLAKEQNLTQDDLSEVNLENSSNLEDILNKRNKSEENKVVSTSANTEYETAPNEEDELQFFGIDNTDLDVNLKKVNALAWFSVNNKRAIDSDKTPKNKAISDFLESNYDLSKVELRFSIDTNTLNNTPLKEYPEIQNALKNKIVPKNVGKLPIIAALYENGKQIEYEGHKIEVHLHDNDFANYDPTIAEAASKEIIEQKTQILQAYYNGKNLKSNITNKSNGHINTQIEKGGKMSKFPLTELFSDYKDIQFSYGSNDMFLDPKTKSTDLDIMSYKVTNGAVYAKVTTANGSTFPLRLNATNLSNQEGELIYNLYSDILVDDTKYSQNISQSIIDYINNNEDGSIKQLGTYLNLNNTTYQQLLDNLVYNGFSKTKDKKESRLYTIKEGVTKEGQKTPRKVFFGNAYLEQSLFLTDEGKDRFIKSITQNRRRQIDVKLLNDPEYKKYLVTNNKLVSNAKPNDKGRIFTQPTLTYNPVFEEVIEKSVINTQGNVTKKDIERRRKKSFDDIRAPKSSRNDENINWFAPYFDISYGIDIVKRTEASTKEELINKINKKYDDELKNLNKSSIPLTITSQVRQQLYDLGYSKVDVDNMKPEEGQSIISRQSVKIKENPIVENIDSEEIELETNSFDLESLLNKTSPVEPIVEETKIEIPKDDNLSYLDKLKKQINETSEDSDSAFKFLSSKDIKSPKDVFNKEVEHIQSLLPKDIAINIQNDYIKVLGNGEVAIGIFKDNMISLTNLAPIGTAYHEAFHAVFRTMLTNKELMNSYKEANSYYHIARKEELNKIKSTHKVDDTEAAKIWLEEQLADDFSAYMLNPNQSVFTYPKGIKGLFERLRDWIKNVFSNKLTIKKLFDDIQRSKYANKTPKFSRDIRYRTLIQLPKTGDTFTPEEIQEITQQLAFVALSKTSNINDLKQIDVNKIEKELFNVIKKADERKDIETQLRAAKVHKNLSHFVYEVQNYIGLIGLDETDEKIEDENGNIIVKSSYEVSGKQNATKNIKFLIGLTPKFKTYNVVTKEKVYDTEGTYLGLPKFANASSTWNKLEKHLSGIVPVMQNGVLRDSFEIMIDKLTELSKYHVELGYVRNQLLNADTQTQTEFHATFSRYKGNYIDSLVSGVSGSMTFKTTSSDSFSKEKSIANLWAYNFRTNFGKYEGRKLVYDPIKLETFKQKYVLLRSSLNKDKTINKQITNTTLGLLDGILNDLGIKISPSGLYKWLEEQPVNEKVTDQNIIFINKVDAFILKLDKALVGSKESSSLFPIKDNNGRTGPIYDSNNHLLGETFFTDELASQEAEFQTISGESTVVGPGGNKIWIYQDNNLMSKTIAAVQSGDTTHIDNVLNSVYGTNSKWAKWLKTNPQEFNISLYGNYKQENVSDGGDKSNNLKDPDKFNDQINKYLKGIYIGLAEADKSQQYYIQGPKLENAQIKSAPDGQIFYENLDSNSVNIIYNYFADEVNRMISAYKQVNGAEALPFENQVMYYHYNYDKKGNLISGNWNKSYLFPNMDLEKYGITKGGIPVPLALDNKDIKKYISDVFMNLVKQDLDKATEYGILDKKGTIYINKTLDSGLVNGPKYEGNVVKAIADYTLNSIIANVEFTKLFTNDPALYKFKGDGFEDFRKRIPLIIASGKDMRIFKDANYEVRSHYTSATIDNIISPSAYFTNNDNLELIAKATNTPLDKVKDLFKSYGEVNQTDAQAWITIDTYKERMLGFGKWSTSHEESFKRIKANSELSSDIKLFAQPLKTVHTESMMHHGVLITQYNKQSEAVLLPTFAKNIELGSILKAMETQGIDHVITLDGKKVGAMGVTKVIDDNGKILDIKDIKLNKTILSNKNLFLQQDLPTKRIKDIQVGSQHVKNVLAMLDLEHQYDDITGLELYAQYNETISRLSDLGLLKLRKSLGFNDENKLKEPKVFYKTLYKTFNGTVSRNILQGINNHVPLDALPQLRRQIQNKLNAMVTRDTVKLKQLGGAMIQMSNFGYIASEVNLNDKVKDGIIWFKNPKEELQPARLVSRKDDKVVFKAAQILIPHSKLVELLAKSGKDYKDLTHNEIKALIDPEVLQGLSYRIPNQGPPSNDVFEIVGILPPEMGDTMVAFKEITTKTGSDFDIDKSFLILPNFKLDEKSGKIVKINEDNTKEGLQNRRFNLTVKMMSNPEKYAQLMSPLDAPWLKELSDKYYPEDKKAKDLFFFTGTNQLQTKSLFDNAKNLVGVIAKHMSHHNLIKHEGMFFNDYYIGKGPTSESLIKEAGIMSEKDINKGYIINGKNSLLAVEKDEAGNLVEESLIAYANAIVDAAKDPFISRANINQFTASTAFMLIRSGVDREWVTTFMGQPILKELVEETGKSEGRISEKQRNDKGNIVTALDKILLKYGYTKGNSKTFKSNLETEGLRNPNGNVEITTNTLVTNLTSSNPINQLQILAQFLEWQNKAKDLSNLMAATSSDTTGATKNQTSATLFVNLVNKVIKDNIFGNLNTMMGYTIEDGQPVFNGNKMIGSYYKNAILASKDMFKDSFLTETPAFNLSLFNIATNAGYRFLQDEELADIINNELYASLVGKSKVAFTDKNELKTLLYNQSAQINWGDTKHTDVSLANQIVSAKGLDIFKDNNLIQSLDVKFGYTKNDPDTIALSPKNLDVDAKNNLYLDWEQILELDPKLGESLIKYAYYSSGFKTNWGVFFEHIPVDWLEKNDFNKFIKDKFSEFSNPLALNESESQIFKHLYKNNKLVPTVNNTVLKPVKINENIVSNEHVIALESTENPELRIGTNKNNTSEYKRFVKRIIKVSNPTQFDPDNSITLTYLYQLSGYQLLDGSDNKTLLYVRTNTLGYDNGTNIIKEYGNDGSTSIFEENNVTLPQEVVDYVSNLDVYPETAVTEFNEQLIKNNTIKSNEDLKDDMFYCKYR